MKTKFLLVDDDADDGILFAEAAREISPDVDCRVVQGGMKLFDLLSSDQRFTPDVIFLDINMPILNGWQVLATLKKDPRYSEIPVVIYSTSNHQGDVNRAYESGAALFLTKPESFDELCEILKVVAIAPQGQLKATLSRFPNVRSG
ncbi:response regulator [Chryseolinea sp. T2]|uniref:response regulator n=1 Tax=Chryseolinea sp. T2 TaxID=3129255 RepID=UPI003077B086